MLTWTSTPAGEATSAPTILLIEDDPAIERTLSRVLGASGYRMVCAATSSDARAFLAEGQPDLIILDLMLPDTDGLILITLLETMSSAPILICSARQKQVDRVIGLKLGAADFVAKPFDLEELEARIEAVLRRSAGTRTRHSQPDEIRVGDLVIKPSRATVKIAGLPVHLTPIEYRLLVTLASEPEAEFTRGSLVKHVWGYEQADCNHHLVDVHVGRLRLKLRSVSQSTRYVVTIRGRGYSLTDEAERNRSE